MAFEVLIPRAFKCFYQGSLSVGNSSVSLPAASLIPTGGRDIEVLLAIETNDVRYQLDGKDATSSSMRLRADTFLRLPGMQVCENIRFIQDTAEVTIRIQSFCMPL